MNYSIPQNNKYLPITSPIHINVVLHLVDAGHVGGRLGAVPEHLGVLRDQMDLKVLGEVALEMVLRAEFALVNAFSRMFVRGQNVFSQVLLRNGNCACLTSFCTAVLESLAVQPRTVSTERSNSSTGHRCTFNSASIISLKTFAYLLKKIKIW